MIILYPSKRKRSLDKEDLTISKTNIVKFVSIASIKVDAHSKMTACFGLLYQL